MGPDIAVHDSKGKSKLVQLALLRKRPVSLRILLSHGASIRNSSLSLSGEHVPPCELTLPAGEHPALDFQSEIAHSGWLLKKPTEGLGRSKVVFVCLFFCGLREWYQWRWCTLLKSPRVLLYFGTSETIQTHSVAPKIGTLQAAGTVPLGQSTVSKETDSSFAIQTKVRKVEFQVDVVSDLEKWLSVLGADERCQ